MIKEENQHLAHLIDTNKKKIIEDVLQKRMEENPLIKYSYKQDDYAHFRNDCAYQIDFLKQSIYFDSPVIYQDYLQWALVLLTHMGFSEQTVRDYFQTFHEIIIKTIDPKGMYLLEEKLINNNRLKMIDYYTEKSYIDENNYLGMEAKKFFVYLTEGFRNLANDYILQLVKDGLSLKDCYLHIFQPTQYEVGRLWHLHQISVAQEHYVSSASQQIMSQFYPIIFNHEKTGKTVVATCINGEQHEIGLRMVTDLMEMEGWDTYFLGANTPISSIIDMSFAKQAKLLAISVTFGSHLTNLAILIQKVKKQNPLIKILVGGYPLNLDNTLWQKVGADGYSHDAISALQEAERLVLS